jgi:hypothetical protein
MPGLKGSVSRVKADMQSYTAREDRMRALARQLFFMVETEGGRFTLIRTADVPTAVREERLTLSEAEELLEMWKLRGPHGG